jgi:transcriptional regulator with XRE-family HTH domain
VPPYRFSKTIFSEQHSKLVELLRTARAQAGLTQVQAAKRLGCRQTFISKIECGERRLDVVEFAVMCGAYGADACEIMKKAVQPRYLQKAVMKTSRKAKKKQTMTRA